MTQTRARPLTNAERQRRYRVRRAAEAPASRGRRPDAVQHLFCRELVGDPDRAAWLVANGMTYKRCRFVEEYTMIRRRSAVGGGHPPLLIRRPGRCRVSELNSTLPPGW